MADALDSGSSPRKGVEVQVLSSAPRNQMIYEPPAAKAAFSSLLPRLFGCYRGILHAILRHRSGIQDAGYWRVEQMFRRQTSPNYLGAQFLSRTQVSCRRYLQMVRTRRAVELLQEHDLSIPQIAAVLGHADTAHLSREIRAELGVSPKRRCPVLRNRTINQIREAVHQEQVFSLGRFYGFARRECQYIDTGNALPV